MHRPGKALAGAMATATVLGVLGVAANAQAQPAGPTVLRGGGPGSCVNSSVQQNQGVDPLVNTPQAVVPYSVAKYIAQKFHSAACLNSACTPNSSGVVCTPTAGLNQFGCDEHGTLKLNSINGGAPTTGTGTGTTINPNFPAAFVNPDL